MSYPIDGDVLRPTKRQAGQATGHKDCAGFLKKKKKKPAGSWIDSSSCQIVPYTEKRKKGSGASTCCMCSACMCMLFFFLNRRNYKCDSWLEGHVPKQAWSQQDLALVALTLRSRKSFKARHFGTWWTTQLWFSQFWNTLSQLVNMKKVPFPAIRMIK